MSVPARVCLDCSPVNGQLSWPGDQEKVEMCSEVKSDTVNEALRFSARSSSARAGRCQQSMVTRCSITRTVFVQLGGTCLYNTEETPDERASSTNTRNPSPQKPRTSSLFSVSCQRAHSFLSRCTDCFGRRDKNPPSGWCRERAVPEGMRKRLCVSPGAGSARSAAASPVNTVACVATRNTLSRRCAARERC